MTTNVEVALTGAEVLLVDDVPENLKVLRGVLGSNASGTTLRV